MRRRLPSECLEVDAEQLSPQAPRAGPAWARVCGREKVADTLFYIRANRASRILGAYCSPFFGHCPIPFACGPCVCGRVGWADRSYEELCLISRVS